MFTLIKNSLANLKGHKLRLIIAFIWIIIGITSVVFVSAVGNGMSAIFKSTFQNIAPKTAIFYFEPSDKELGRNQVMLDPFLSSDVQAIAALDGVEKVEPSKKFAQTMPGFDENTLMGNFAYFDKSGSSQILPIEKAHYKVIKGRSLTEADEGKRVIVLESNAVKDLFGEDEKNPIGKGVTLNGLTFEVVGVLDSDTTYDPVDKTFKKRGMFDVDNPYSVIPSTAYGILTGTNIKSGSINSMVVTVKDGFEMETVTKSIEDNLASLHPDINGEYKVQDQSSIQKSTEAFTKGIDKFVKIITVVAMIVGGVGIMNIMYVSVMERNKEIGIRRALGAKPRSILFQFLVESVFITSFGGILGVIVGYAVTIYSKNIMPFRPIPSFNSFLYAVISIVLTGIIFGLVPAYKASKVDPIKIIYK